MRWRPNSGADFDDGNIASEASADADATLDGEGSAAVGSTSGVSVIEGDARKVDAGAGASSELNGDGTANVATDTSASFADPAAANSHVDAALNGPGSLDAHSGSSVSRTIDTDSVSVGAESNASADVIGDGSANAHTDASSSLPANGETVGAAATSADGTLDGEGAVDLGSGIEVVKQNDLSGVSAEARPSE